MHPSSFSPRGLVATLLVAIAGLLASGWALADPPSRVARLAYATGAISFSPGGERDWVRASVNRPLVTGDRLWVGEGARAELQLGSAAVRVGAGTSLTLLTLDDRVAQVQLAQGTLNIRVRRLDRGQVFEIDTPNLAYSIRRPGSYRIDVDPDGEATTVSVRKGLAEVYGEGAAFVTGEGQTYRFFGSGLRDYQSFARMRADEFDRWASERDRRWDNSASRRYVSPELIGYEDLDRNGSWRKVRDYGSVWVPDRVAADWAPYRDGHWAWVEPWGWTWIDEAPWGFATSHYGRWARIDNTWAWVPGPATARPVYAPALVAFVGGSDPRSSGGRNTVAWFPLGPRDVYRPSYSASREYFNSVNTSNTVINRGEIGNRYGNAGQASVSYSNQQVAGAVVVMLATAFAESRPANKEMVRGDRETFSRAPVAAAAPVAPVHASVVGGGAAFGGARPPEKAQARPVVAQVAPPPPPAPFAARQGALAANAGKPHDAAAVAAAKPAAPVEAPAVKVVTPTQAVAAPPRPASAPAGGQASFGGRPTLPPAAAAPTASAPSAAPSRSSDRGATFGARPPGQPLPVPAPPPVPVPAPAPAPAAAARASAPVGPAAAAPAPGASAPREERGRRQPPAAANGPEPSRAARATVTAPVAPPVPPVAAPPAAPARPVPPAAAPVAPAPPAAAAPPPTQRAVPAVPPTPPAAAGPPPTQRAAPAVPPTPPAAAAPPPPVPPRAVPAMPPPAAGAASAAAPASAAGPGQRGRSRGEEGEPPGRREAASEARRQRDPQEPGRKP